MAEMVGDGDEVVFGILRILIFSPLSIFGEFFPLQFHCAAIYRPWSPLAGRLPRALSIASAATLGLWGWRTAASHSCSCNLGPAG